MSEGAKEEPVLLLKSLLDRPAKKSASVKTTKYSISISEVEFTGFKINGSCYQPDPTHFGIPVRMASQRD